MNDQLLDTPIQKEITSSEIRKLTEYAVPLLADAGLSTSVVTNKIMEKGHSQETAFQVIQLAFTEIKASNLSKARKDIIVGAVFFVLGIILTFANIGFIFWGAIVFGAIQCIRGVINLGNARN